MAGYVALSWRPGGDAAPLLGLDQLLQSPAIPNDWFVADRADGFCLLLERARPLKIGRSTDGAVRILGDLFERSTSRLAPARVVCPTPQAGLDDLCLHLTRAYWGRYVVLQPDRAGDMAAFRDPSGAVDVVTWRNGAVTIAASGIPDWLPSSLAPRLTLNWAAVARFLVDPAALASSCGLDGVTAIDPGMIHWPSKEQEPTVVWRPASFALASARVSPAEARAAIVRAVDDCVTALSAAAGPMLAEVSGGLDSSIVASGLVGVPQANILQWVNFHAADLQGDERRYARALAERQFFPLTEIAKPELLLTDEALDDQVIGLRPSLNGLDQHYDADLADRCAALGARSIITGQGGDIVFFHTPTSVVAADAWRGRTWRWSEIADSARWTRRSVWSVLGAAAHAAGGGGRHLSLPLPDFLSPKGLASSVNDEIHPWLTGLDGVAPAKRLQIRSLVNAQAFHGDCRRGRQAELLHPLLSQPVVELCLSIPAIDLTRGGRGRALAREAFAHRLPDIITQRRSKGDLTAYYGRMLARSLPALRPYLLDGVIAGHGFIARDVLDQMLTQEHLIWHGDYAYLLRLLAVESWARHWSQRVGVST